MVQSIKYSNLKIVLTSDEVQRLFGEGSIDIKSEKTVKVMDKILHYAAKKLHFEISGKKTVVEIFEKPNGSCVIYFIGVCQNDKEVVLEFDCINDLITVANELVNVEFSSYFYKGLYRIVAKLTPKTEGLVRRMCEFSKVNFDREEVARTKEYGVNRF